MKFYEILKAEGGTAPLSLIFEDIVHFLKK